MSNNNNFSATSDNSYSKALYELANENKILSEIENQVLVVTKLISQSEDFKLFIKNPTNKQEEQLRIVNLISETFRANQLLKKFLGFLVLKRRLFYIEKILNDFLKICSIKRGEMLAQLTAARNLNEIEIKKIKDEISEVFGLNIMLKFKFDPSLIGGLIIQVGSVMIDTSIKNKLQKIENRMLEA